MRINHKITTLALCLSMAGLTSSCRLFTTVTKHADRTLDKIQSVLDEPVPPSDMYSLDTISVKDDIWLGSQSIRGNQGDPLPARFETEEGITLVSTTPVSLLQVSEQITALTGITVRVDDMILEEVKNATQGKAENAAQGTATNTDTDLYMPAYSGKLSGLLDQIVSRFALWWRYKNGVITFYKQETRVFTIYALPVQTQLNANIAGTASGEAGGTTSASMSSTISLDLWAQIEEAITAMLPGGATLNVIPANGTLTVTAPPYTLQRVAQYINSMNEKLSRQVAIGVKVMNVTLSDEASMGLNLSSVLNFISKKSGSGISTSLTTPSSTTSGTSGSLSIGILNPNGHGHIADGSKILLEALSTQGTASLVTSASVITMNNKIAPVQVSTNESYIEKSETTVSSDTTSISVTPAKINYGFTMEILPRLLDHGRMLLMFTMTLTDKDSMDEKQFGEGSSRTSIQLPVLKTRGFVQEVAMTSGSTLVLTGFEEVRTNSNSSKDITSFSKSADKSRNVMVILLTPEVLISPLVPETRMNGF